MSSHSKSNGIYISWKYIILLALIFFLPSPWKWVLIAVAIGMILLRDG